MKILIRGGVWKNTEDEILKAAVMKYGLNQWARISSLLVRKSAKQCKARWYEWLDPSIKKTEWTKEEDEKLLHLAKLMPTQWRTIAPIIGRTPTQCLERYEKLLDMVANKDADYDPTDDPRRLRPGEIDPNPESKPARPDPIDMDEDEKEMLSEARARLANTKGKKAKRKARERQLEEAKRLAHLQKKRELRAAGIRVRSRYTRRRGIDYNREVAFEAKPAAGFYDTAADEERSEAVRKEFRPITLEQLEGKRRKDVEKDLRKQDIARDKMMARHNQPEMLARIQAATETSYTRRRGKMMLPAPQVSESELASIAKGGGGDIDEEMGEGAGGDATRTLLGDYQTVARLPTDIRTPRTAAAGQDSIMAQAENLARLTAAQTPLMGGENPELNPTDFAGIQPKAAAVQTPNPLAQLTPAHGGAGGSSTRVLAGVSATPRLGGETPGVSIGATPLRDQLGLNAADTLGAGGTRAERARQALLKNELRAGLSQLPSPSMEYAIEAPELPEEEGVQDMEIEEDAADREARIKALAAAREEEARRRRSQVLQRSLPRPLTVDGLPQPLPVEQQASLGLRARAEQLVLQELQALLAHDAAKYPLQGRKRGRALEYAELEDEFPMELLQQAKEMLALETVSVRTEMGHTEVEEAEYHEAWAGVVDSIIFLESKGGYGRTDQGSSDALADLRAQHDALRKDMEKQASRAAKLGDRHNLITNGLQQRADKLVDSISTANAALIAADMELRCFETLQEQELRTAPLRVAAMKELVKVQRSRERALQGRFKQLRATLDDLVAA